MFKPRMPSVLLALSLSTVMFSQTILHTDPAAWSGPVPRNVVRDANGTMYALSASVVGKPLEGPLLLQKSTDGGATWTTLPFTFNDANSGLVPTPTGWAGVLPINSLTRQCSLAIDGQGRLHALFSNFAGMFYRNYHPVTDIASPITFMGHPHSENSLVIDWSNVVWIAMSTGPGLNDQRLIASNAPYAAGNAFTDLGSVSPDGGVWVADTNLVVDAVGAVHCVFQWNGGFLRHRRYVPGVGWDPGATVIAAASIVLHQPRLAADWLDNVHCLFMESQPNTSLNPNPIWHLRYMQWQSASGWSSAVTVMDVTPPQYMTVSNSGASIHAIGCDEWTGRVTAVYRSLATNGALVVAEKGLLDYKFNTTAQLTPASTGFEEYLAPTIRGALFPAFNWTGQDIDITWSHRPGMTPDNQQSTWHAPTAEFVFAHRASSSCWMSTPSPLLIGTSITLPLDCPFDGNASYALGCSFGTSPGIVLLDGRVVPLNADPLLELSLTPNPFLTNSIGVLSASGTGAVGMSIPNVPAIIGTTFYAGFVTLSGSPLGITSISPARQLQIN